MKKVIIIYDDKKEKLISLAIDEDYIEDIEYIKKDRWMGWIYKSNFRCCRMR